MSLRNGWHDRLDRLQRMRRRFASRAFPVLRSSAQRLGHGLERLRTAVRDSSRCRECGEVTPLGAEVCEHCGAGTPVRWNLSPALLVTAAVAEVLLLAIRLS